MAQDKASKKGNMKALVDGRIVCESEKSISPVDYGLLYGLGVFESLRCGGGHPLMVKQHTERLNKGLKELEIPFEASQDIICGMIEKTLKANGLSNAYARITVTKGAGEPLLGCAYGGATTVVIARKLPPKRLTASITVCKRYTVYSGDPLRRIKSTNYALNSLARSQAKFGGFDDAVLVNERGHVAECASANIFLVSKGKIITPSIDCGALPGITRAKTMDWARDMGLTVKQTRINPKILGGADEIFKTSAVSGIIACVKVERKAIGDGDIGPVTSELMKRWSPD